LAKKDCIISKHFLGLRLGKDWADGFWHRRIKPKQLETVMKKDRCMVSYENKIKNFADQIKGKKILDVGCGNGNYTAMFAHDDNKVVGVDINDFRQKKFIKNFRFVKYKGKKLPFKNQEFDIVVSFDVVEHVENDVFFIGEIYRVLRKGGDIYLATPNRTRLSNLLMSIAGKPVKYPYVLSDGGRLGEVVHLREYVGKELAKLLLKKKFLNINVELFWFGLRGRVNCGFRRPIIKSLAQYLFIKARK